MTTATKYAKRAPENLKCSVCHQLFKKPKYLPCFHSYCEQCLEKMQVRSKIICRECKKETNIPPDGIKGFSDSFFISHLVDEFILKCKIEGEIEVNCDECSEKDSVVAFCSKCTMFLCHVCNEHHKRSNKYRGHAIIPLPELKSKQNIAFHLKPKPMICREHNEELSFNCETCDHLVCSSCIVKGHILHSHNMVNKLADKHRLELMKEIASVEDMIMGLSDTQSNFEKIKKKIQQQGDEISKKIDQHYDGVIQKIMKEKEQLKEQVLNTVLKKERAITTHLEEIKYVQAELLNIKELNDVLEKCFGQECL